MSFRVEAERYQVEGEIRMASWLLNRFKKRRGKEREGQKGGVDNGFERQSKKKRV